MGSRLEVLAAAILFGTTGTAQALGPAGLSPATVGAARIVVGGAALGCLALATPRSDRRLSPALVLLAGAAVAAYQLTFFVAVHRAGVAVGAVVAIGSGPVVAGLLDYATGRPWPGSRWLVATVLAIAGIAALATGPSGTSTSAAGILLALASGAAYASYTVIAKRLLDRGAEPVRVMGAAFGTAAVLLLPVLVAGNTAWLHHARGVELALYLAAGPTVLAYVLFARGLRRLSAAETTTIVLAEPVTATLLGVAVLHEALGPSGVAGIALVLGGIVLIARRPREA